MTPSIPPIDWELLQRYHAGETTDTESEQVEKILQELPQAAALLQAFGHVVHLPTEPAVWVETEQAYEALRQRMQRSFGTDIREEKRSTSFAPPAGLRAQRYQAMRGYRFYSAVAALVVCLVGAMGWLLTHSPAVSAPSRSSQDYATNRGQRATVTLADGSTVFLGPQSHLRVSRTFGTTSRQVSLSGAAVFTIVHVSKTPFVVQAGNTLTQVLGTTFAIRNYATDSSVQIVVAQGRIMVDRSAILSTGDFVRVTPNGIHTFAHHTDIATALGWTQDKLTFDHVAFHNAVPDLERQYDIDIRIADTSIAMHTITAAFSTQSTDEVLSELALLLDARVLRHGRRIVFAAARGPNTSNGDFWPLNTTPLRRDIPLTQPTTPRQVAVHAAPLTGISR